MKNYQVGDRIAFRRGSQMLQGEIIALDPMGTRADLRRVTIKTEVRDWLGQAHAGNVTVMYPAILGLVEEAPPVGAQESEEARIARMAALLGLKIYFGCHVRRRGNGLDTPQSVTLSRGDGGATRYLGTVSVLAALTDEELCARMARLADCEVAP